MPEARELRQGDERCLTQASDACRGIPEEETSSWEQRAGSNQLSEGGKEYSRQRQQLHQGSKTTERGQNRGYECDLIWLDHRIYACGGGGMWVCACVCICIQGGTEEDREVSLEGWAHTGSCRIRH